MVFPENNLPEPGVSRPPATATGGRFSDRLPFFLFFVSGFCGLVYEVVWSRMLVLVMGNTTLATSTILASFMAGLALGSWWWGRFIDARASRALVIFGCLETGIGLIGLASVWAPGTVSPAEIWLLGTVHRGYDVQVLIRFLFCFVLLVCPTFLMGGTFAVIGRHVIREETAFGRDTAMLYGINTAGAVAGAFMAGFFLIRCLGHSGSIGVAVFLNLTVGAAAVLSGIRSRRRAVNALDRPETAPPPARRAFSASSRIAVMAALGLSGFCALAYQVLWTRLLILVIDNSVYSFTIILVSVLAGISLGSLFIAPLFRRLKRPLVFFSLLQAGIGWSAFCFPFFVHMAPMDINVTYWHFLWSKLPLVILVPTLLMGAALPLAADIFQAGRGNVGHSLGTVFSVNTIGGVAGAVAAGFLLMPRLGLQKSCLLLLGVNLAAAGLAGMTGAGRTRALATLAALVLVMACGVVVMPSDYFSRKYGELEPKARLVYYGEGRAATATVFQRPDRSRILYLNGMPEVDTSVLSVRTLKMLGTLPAILHKDPSSALMITFGAGISAGMTVRFVDRIDCVDVADQVPKIAPWFRADNNHVLENPRFSLVIDDARHFLKNTHKRYSVIVSDATHPRSYDSWVLFTSDFYRLVRRRLHTDGIFCQWVPFHGLNRKQYMGIVRTFYSVFPHTSIWRFGRAYTLLLATPDRLNIRFRSVLSKMLRKDVRRDLARAGITSPFQLLSHFAAGENRVAEMVKGFPGILTDNSPAHLFFPPGATLKEQYRTWPEENLRRLHDYSESIVPYVTDISPSKSVREKVIRTFRRFEMKQTW